jgi:hypothetical protein
MDEFDGFIDFWIPEEEMRAFRYLLTMGLMQIARPVEIYQREAISIGLRLLKEMTPIEKELAA